MTTHTQILIATDGGAKDNYGSFSWVIGTTDDILWTGRGQVTGEPIHSFRSESVALLSVLIFLREYMKYHQIPSLTQTIQIVTDSESLIKRCQRLSEHDIADWWSGIFIWPDIDTTIEICTIQQDLPFDFKLEFVPSHQDLYKPFHSLDREAQLNVLADKEATSALQSIDKHCKFLRMPHCPVYMQHNGKYITSKN